MIRSCLALVLLVALAPPADADDAAPTVPFAGAVLEKGTRTALAGVEVAVEGVAASAFTDEEGRFAFAAVPVGRRKVSVRGSGHIPADTDEVFDARKRLSVTYYIAPTERYRTVVRGDKLLKQTVEQTLDLEELKRIPGTQGDALKAVQTLPGVARTPFGLGQLIVWGSSPLDTRTYVDGVFIPTLYHFGGLRSTVNAELVQSLTFTPGGYGTDYGRGLGGVVELETRRPKDNGLHGYVALDLIDGALLVEGPLTKNLSVAVAARRSWIDVFLPLFTTNDFQLSPRYWDYQAALRWRASSRDQVDVFLFGSDDTVDVTLKAADPEASAAFHSHTYYHRLLARLVHRFAGGATLTVTPSIGYDVPFEVKAQIGTVQLHVDPSIISYNLRATLRAPITGFLRIDAGLDFEGNAVPFDATAAPTGMPREGDPMAFGGGLVHDATTLHIVGTAPWVAAVFSLLDGRLTVSPGLRLEVIYLGGYHGDPASFDHGFVEWEPRLAVRFQQNRYLAYKLAIGAYHQPPDSPSLSRAFGNPNLRPESAFQYVVGADIQATPSLRIEVTGFYKDMRALLARESSAGGILDNNGQGRVYGGELLIRQQLWRGLFGWIAYTLSRADRRDPGSSEWRRFDFDQTHILSVLASYQLPFGMQIGARFRYVTGNPYTPVVGAYFDANSDAYVRLRGPLNSGRLESFHQLDLRIDKTFTFRLWRLGLYLDIQNLYNHANTEQLRYGSRPEDGSLPVAGLPFFPSLGVRGDF